VRQVEVAIVRRQLENYARLRVLSDEWIDASVEFSRLRLEQQSELSGKTQQPTPRT